MFANCDAKIKIKIYNEYLDTVDQFKYLGIEISNKSINPEGILQARLIKANSMYQAVKTNCRTLGLSNVRIKI